MGTVPANAELPPGLRSRSGVLVGHETTHTVDQWTRSRTPSQDGHVNTESRPVALVTGVGRRLGIGAAIAKVLAEDGWDIGFTYWKPYDVRMPGVKTLRALQPWRKASLQPEEHPLLLKQISVSKTRQPKSSTPWRITWESSAL